MEKTFGEEKPSQRGGHLPPSLSLKLSSCLSPRSWPIERKEVPARDQARAHSGESAVRELIPRSVSPVGTLAGLCQEGRRAGPSECDQTPPGGNGVGREGSAIMQTPVLRSEVDVPKWTHPCTRDKHAADSPASHRDGCKASQSFIPWLAASDTAKPARVTPPPGPVLS